MNFIEYLKQLMLAPVSEEFMLNVRIFERYVYLSAISILGKAIYDDLMNQGIFKIFTWWMLTTWVLYTIFDNEEKITELRKDIELKNNKNK